MLKSLVWRASEALFKGRCLVDPWTAVCLVLIDDIDCCISGRTIISADNTSIMSRGASFVSVSDHIDIGPTK